MGGGPHPQMCLKNTYNTYSTYQLVIFFYFLLHLFFMYSLSQLFIFGFWRFESSVHGGLSFLTRRCESSLTFSAYPEAKPDAGGIVAGFLCTIECN